MSKYSNKKTLCDGILFDSKAEAKRWMELKALENLGAIEGLVRQKTYRLVKGKWNNGKAFSISYRADFVYNLDGEVIVEDVKGYKTEAYELKKKLMKAIYNIEIVEVRR